MIDLPFSDVQAWVAYFTQANIPVLRHTANEIKRLSENSDSVNARTLAAVILHDPLMTLRVLYYIETKRGERQVTDITTIERALMMIGIDPFFREFADLSYVEEQLRPYPKSLIGLLKVIARARKAAQWAREWAIIRHDLDVDEITVATLLHDVAEILMWCFAPALAVRVRDAQAADRSRRSVEVQSEIYGLPLYQLKMELAKAWRLPALISMLMDNENAENPRVRNVKLAVDLARHSANGWNDAALPDDYKAIEELTHLSHENLMNRLGLEYKPPEEEAEAPVPTTAPVPPAD